jgi:molecular chaperone Hsp33
MSDSFVHRFIFEHLEIRGAFVRLGECWRQMQADRSYPAPVAQVLGEMAAVTGLIAGQLKQPGRLTFQLRSDGPIRLLVIDCNENLQMRGMARSEGEISATASPLDLLGAAAGGQLLLSLDIPTSRQPWQSIVPLVGNSIADIFEHYLEQSEQQASRLYLAANAEAAACLFLQKLPEADAHDADGWNRVQQLAATATPEELCSLPTEALLTRLYHEDMVRLFDPQTVVYHCPEDREKIRGMIVSLGRDEAERIVAEHGEIVVKDDICNREYRFSADEIAALFANLSLH